MELNKGWEMPGYHPNQIQIQIQIQLFLSKMETKYNEAELKAGDTFCILNNNH